MGITSSSVLDGGIKRPRKNTVKTVGKGFEFPFPILGNPVFAEAVELAVQAGARRETVEIVDVEDVPLQYHVGNTCRVKVKAAGELA